MIHKETKTVPRCVVSDITCDICGNSCYTGIDYEHVHMYTRWGYGSKRDGESWEAHICEKCVDDHLIGLINFRKTDT